MNLSCVLISSFKSAPNLPFFFSQLKLSNGREEGVRINPLFEQSDLALCFLTANKDHAAEFLQLQHRRGNHSHSALAHNMEVCRRLLHWQELLQSLCCNATASRWRLSTGKGNKAGESRGRTAAEVRCSSALSCTSVWKIPAERHPPWSMRLVLSSGRQNVNQC